MLGEITPVEKSGQSFLSNVKAMPDSSFLAAASAVLPKNSQSSDRELELQMIIDFITQGNLEDVKFLFSYFSNQQVSVPDPDGSERILTSFTFNEIRALMRQELAGERQNPSLLKAYGAYYLRLASSREQFPAYLIRNSAEAKKAVQLALAGHVSANPGVQDARLVEAWRQLTPESETEVLFITKPKVAVAADWRVVVDDAVPKTHKVRNFRVRETEKGHLEISRRGLWFVYDEVRVG